MPNRMIYLTQQNFDTLSSEENASGLVNRLLTNYFAGRTRISTTGLVAKDDKMQKFEELRTQFKPIHEQIVAPIEEAA